MSAWFSHGGNRREEPAENRQLPQPSVSSGSNSSSSLAASFTPSFLRASDAREPQPVIGGGRSRSSSLIDGARDLIGAHRDASETVEDAASTLCPGLTLKQRAIGLACCVGFGVLLDVSSFGRISEVLRGKAGRFAFLYTVGNLCSLCGTLFLAGPRRQCERMASERRWMASMVFVASMIVTIAVAEANTKFHGRTLLILFLVFVQWCALTWYALSYIPFGRTVVWHFLRRWCFGCCAESS